MDTKNEIRRSKIRKKDPYHSQRAARKQSLEVGNQLTFSLDFGMHQWWLGLRLVKSDSSSSHFSNTTNDVPNERQMKKKW